MPLVNMIAILALGSLSLDEASVEAPAMGVELAKKLEGLSMPAHLVESMAKSAMEMPADSHVPATLAGAQILDLEPVHGRQGALPQLDLQTSGSLSCPWPHAC